MWHSGRSSFAKASKGQAHTLPKCPGGEMADTYASGAYEETHEGSSPSLGTRNLLNPVRKEFNDLSKLVGPHPVPAN